MLNLKIKLTEEMFNKVGYDEVKAENIGYSNYSYWHSTFRTFWKNKVSMTLFIIMCVFVLISFVYPIIVEMLPNWETSYNNPNFFLRDTSTWNLAPSAEHWFGTDNIGKDIWIRTWYGTRTSLCLGFVIAFFDITLGVLAGALWGYVKKIDRFMTELYNVMTNIQIYPYQLLFPTIVLSFVTVSFYIVGNKFADASDPRNHL